MTKWSLVSLALVTGVGCAVACSSSGDDSTSPAGGAGGSTSSAGKGGSTSTAGAGTSTAGKGGATSTAGTGGATVGEGGAGSTTLYDRLGGNSGITAAVAAIVKAETMEPDIASYFSQQANPAHAPTVSDIEQCLVLQLGSASGGPEVYPGKTTSGFTCRSMLAAHADLGINSGTFDKFVSIAAGVLTSAGVSSDDVTTVGGVLNGTKTSIVTDTTTTAERACTAPSACAEAGAGGAG